MSNTPSGGMPVDDRHDVVDLASGISLVFPAEHRSVKVERALDIGRGQINPRGRPDRMAVSQ